jgi:hypothetical protein
MWAWPELVAVCELLKVQRDAATSLSIVVHPESVVVIRNDVTYSSGMTGKELWVEPVFQDLLTRIWGAIPQPSGVMELKIHFKMKEAVKVECTFYAGDATASDVK